MNKIVKYTAVTVIVAATGFTTLAATAGWGGHRGNCDRSEFRGGPSMMMKQMGKQSRFADRDLNLTAEEAKTLVEARLIMKGNDRLKVGQVVESDLDTYLVDIVTVDDSLVRQVKVNRDNGLPRGPFGPKK